MRSDIVRDEGPWVELARSVGPGRVFEGLISLGLSPATAGSIASWLDDQAHRRRLVTGQTSTKYRRILRELGPPMSWGYGERYSGVAQSRMAA